MVALFHQQKDSLAIILTKRTNLFGCFIEKTDICTPNFKKRENTRSCREFVKLPVKGPE